MAALAQVQMNTGHKVSALLHGGLILWVLVFDLFEAPESPIMPEVTEVSIDQREVLQGDGPQAGRRSVGARQARGAHRFFSRSLRAGLLGAGLRLLSAWSSQSRVST